MRLVPSLIDRLPGNPGDRLLLATDGLYRMFIDPHMLRVLQEHASPQAAADQLVAMAQQRRNDDGATCVVVDLGLMCSRDRAHDHPVCRECRGLPGGR